MLDGMAALQLIQAAKISLRSTTIGGRSIILTISVASNSLKLEFTRDRFLAGTGTSGLRVISFSCVIPYLIFAACPRQAECRRAGHPHC
jgi:hypothetical protein